MNAEQRNRALAQLVRERTRVELSPYDAGILRRASLTLRSWATAECNGDIQREEATGLTFRHYGRGTTGPFLTERCADREAGALRRVAEVCQRTGLHFYHQTDPRGAALYVAAEPLTAQTYSGRGVAC